MKIGVICAALAPGKTRLLAELALNELKQLGTEAEYFDLDEYKLPFAGSPGCWDHPEAKRADAKLKEFSGMLVSAPCYNYYVNAALKNLVELTGGAWEDKVVGFLMPAGGQSSYMSVMSFADQLMLDFRTFIVPRFVYVTSDAWEGQRLKDDKIAARIAELAKEVTRVTRALSK